MVDQRRQNFERVRPHYEFVMICAHVFGNATRVMQLAEILFLKTDGKGLDRRTRFFAHQRDHCARVDAAGKKRAERNFRHQPHFYGIAKDANRLLSGFLFRDVELG